MNKITAYIRHNPGVSSGVLVCCSMLFWAYACQSTVVSLVNQNRHITRSELIAEVEAILASAESKFDDLDRQDLVRDTIFNSALELAAGGTPNPIGVILTLSGILGVGAIGDNIKKRTHINTLKGDNLNAKVKESLKKILQPTKD